MLTKAEWDGESQDIDYGQCWHLLSAYLLVDYLRLSPLRTPRVVLRAVGVLCRAWFGFSVMGLAAALTAATAGTYFVGVVSLLLMTTFLIPMATVSDSSLLFGAADEEILGFQPISLKTYSFVKSAAATLHAAELGVLSSTPALLVLWYRWRNGAVVLTAVLANTAAAVVIVLWSRMLHQALTRRRDDRDWLAMASGVIGLSFMLIYFSCAALAFAAAVPGPHGLEHLTGITLNPDWLLLLPSTWFATYVEIVDGTASSAHQLLAVVSLLMFTYAVYVTVSGPTLYVRQPNPKATAAVRRVHVPERFGYELRASLFVLFYQVLGHPEARLRLLTLYGVHFSTLILAVYWGVTFQSGRNAFGFLLLQASVGSLLGAVWEIVVAATSGPTAWLVLCSPADRSQFLRGLLDSTFLLTIFVPLLLIFGLVWRSDGLVVASCVAVCIALIAYVAFQVRLILRGRAVFASAEVRFSTSVVRPQMIVAGLLSTPIAWSLLLIARRSMALAMVMAGLCAVAVRLIGDARFGAHSRRLPFGDL